MSFSSRVVSAADSQEPWRLPRPSGVELRPNTTANSFRHDPTSKSVGRKISDYSLHLGVVGYAAGIHGGDSFLRERNSATIAEDEELVDDDFTVTGTSGFFRKISHCVTVSSIHKFILQSRWATFCNYVPVYECLKHSVCSSPSVQSPSQGLVGQSFPVVLSDDHHFIALL